MKDENSTLHPSRSKEEWITLSVLTFLVMLLSLCGNLLIVVVLLKTRRLRCTFANQLVLSLAITDVATAVLPMNYQLATFLKVSLISREGLVCMAGGLSSYVLFLISMFTLVMLSIDRFLALGCPLKYVLHLTIKVKAIMIAYPWIHGALFGILCGVFVPIKFDPMSMDCGIGWKNREDWFIVSVLSVNFVVPFVLLTIMNVMTFRLVRSQNNNSLFRETTEEVGLACMTKRRGKF